MQTPAAERLRTARVLLVGLGGLGSPAALALAAAGVGHLGLLDADTVDETNLQRQVIHANDQVGVPKVLSAARRLARLYPQVSVTPLQQTIERENAAELLQGYDIVVDGSDNFRTRYVVNDACVAAGKPLVHGSILRFEGQVSVFWPSRPGHGPCYRCIFPKAPPEGSVATCSEAGVFGALPGVVGSLMAAETVKLITGEGMPLLGRLLVYDALTMSMHELKLRAHPQCPACSAHADPAQLTLPLGPNCELPAGRGPLL